MEKIPEALGEPDVPGLLFVPQGLLEQAEKTTLFFIETAWNLDLEAHPQTTPSGPTRAGHPPARNGEFLAALRSGGHLETTRTVEGRKLDRTPEGERGEPHRGLAD